MLRSTWLLSACVLAVAVVGARAETVELANGEVLRGTVISLDAKELKFNSESLGEVSISREKIAIIRLSDAFGPFLPPPTRPVINTPVIPALPKPGSAPAPTSVEDLLKQLQGASQAGGKTVNPADLLQQLEGGNSPELDELKKNPLLAAPEVQGYIKKQLGGLIDGTITINDIRKEAIRAAMKPRLRSRTSAPMRNRPWPPT